MVGRFRVGTRAPMRLVARCLTALTAAAVAGAAGPAAIAGAQVVGDARPTLQTLRPGDTVRVWAAAPRLVRTVALVDRLDGNTLALQDVPGRRALAGGAVVPLPALAYLEVQRGHRRSVGLTLVGVVLGLTGGAVVGGFTGVALECGRSCADEGEFGGLAGAVIGGGLGALAGAITGGIIGGHRRPRWVAVALPAR